KYKIFNGMTSTKILRRLSRGEVLRRKVTIPEGFNLYEIAARLDANDITNSDDILYYSTDSKFLKSLGVPSSSLEGYLFPDTYIFAEESDARDIIIIMNNRLKSILKSIDLTNLKKLNLNINQLLNLASLIEAEAKIASERRYISAVFHNRLRRGIKLGCDPTVRYAVKKFKGRIRYSDLKYNSPYNTYLYPGLPPTPICSPGKESIL
ncbi:MAG: endolytic transglycosylase MltG, partial [bacterium]|nr:endolytic transglycosylase MltG [bacterium]